MVFESSWYYLDFTISLKKRVTKTISQITAKN
jgi:hypothetical protein